MLANRVRPPRRRDVALCHRAAGAARAPAPTPDKQLIMSRSAASPAGWMAPQARFQDLAGRWSPVWGRREGRAAASPASVSQAPSDPDTGTRPGPAPAAVGLTRPCLRGGDGEAPASRGRGAQARREEAHPILAGNLLG